MAMDRATLVAEILKQAPNQDVAYAMLVGSMGESNQDPSSSGSGGGGAFGFTPPNYPASLETAPPAQQVAAILPSYVAAAQQIPSTVTNPAARAEWIAIAAERPLGYTGLHSGELGQIESTNAPTTYGANSSLDVQSAYQTASQEASQGGYSGSQTATLTSDVTDTNPATVTAGVNTTTPSQAIPQVPGMSNVPALVKYINQNWPTYSWLLNVPDVAQVLEQSVANGLSDTQIQAAVAQTGWWQNTASSVQQFDQLKATKPGELAFTPGTQASQQYVTVQQAAEGAGLRLSVGQLQQLALKSMEFGWSPAQLSRNIGTLAATGTGSSMSASYLQQLTQNPQQLEFSKPGAPGKTQADTALADVTSAAANAGLKLGQPALQSIAMQSLMGGWSSTQLQQYIAQTAGSGLGQTLSPSYTQGLQSNPEQYQFSPNGQGRTLADQQLAAVESAARAAGINISPGKAQDLASQALEYGWPASYISDNIGALAGGVAQGQTLSPQYLQMQRANPAELEFTANGNTQADQAYDTVRTAAMQAGVQLSQPRLQDLATQYLRYGWSAGQLATYIGQVAGSGGGRTLSPQYLQGIRANPQEYQFTATGNTQADQALAAARTAAIQAGVELSQGRLQSLAMQSLEYGWTSDQLTTYVGQLAGQGQTLSPTYLQGIRANPDEYQFTAKGNTQADQALASVRTAAQQAGLSLSTTQLQNLATDSLKYGWTGDQTTQEIAQMAGAGGGQTLSPQYLQLRQSNPQELAFTAKGNTQADQALAQARTAAQQAGLTFSTSRLQDLALQSLEYGWSPAQLTQNIAQVAGQGKGQTLSSQFLQLRQSNPQELAFTGTGNTQADQALAQARTAAQQAGLSLSLARLQSLAMQSLEYGWTPDELTQEIAQVAGQGQGKTLSSSYLQLKQSNPQELAFTPTGTTQADQALAAVRNAANTAGLKLTDGRLHDLAMEDLEYGWTPEQVTQNIGQLAGGGQGQVLSPTYLQGMAANPKEYQFSTQGTTQADQALATVRDTAAQAGLQLPTGRLQALAMQSLEYGWTSQQLAQNIAQSAGQGQGKTLSSQYLQGLISNPQEYRFTPGGGDQTEADQMLTQVEASASQQGVNLTLAETEEIATNALKFGWSGPDIQRAIGQFVYVKAPPPAPAAPAAPAEPGAVRPGTPPGTVPAAALTAGAPGGLGVNTNAGALVQQLRTAGAQYFQDPADPSLQQWSQNIANGTQTMQQYQAYLAEQAAQKYPGMADQIQQGLTPSQIASNLQSLAASTLEVDPSQVNFTSNPMYAKMLDGGYDTGANGTQVSNGQMMTYSQAGSYLRGLPQYATTTGARSSAADLEQSILQTFGRVS
jgi:hypothetical protein